MEAHSWRRPWGSSTHALPDTTSAARAPSMKSGRTGHLPPDAWLAIALIGSFAVFLIRPILGVPSGVAWSFELVAESLPFALAAILIARRSRGPQVGAHTWLLLAAGLLIYLLGSLSSYGLLTALEGSSALISNVLWLAAYALLGAFVLIFMRRRMPVVLPLAWIDVLVFGCAAIAIGATVLDATVLSGIHDESPIMPLVDSAYVLGDLALLALVLMAIRALRWRPPITWWLLAAALLAWAVPDVIYFLQFSWGSYSYGYLMDVMWSLGVVLFGLAAYFDDGRHLGEGTAFSVSYFVPGASLLSVGLVLALSGDGPLAPIVTISGLAALGLAVVRMTITIRQGIDLGDRLSRSQVDILTGLPNMRALRDLRPASVRGAALIVLDLVGFSEINRSLGHDAGDQVLVAVAGRIRDSLRVRDVVVRLGGDEFGVLLSDTGPADAAQVAETLITALERPLTINAVPLRVTACAGVAGYGPEACDVETMLGLADGARVMAASDGPGLVRIAAGGHGLQSLERLRVRADIRASFDAGGSDFLVYYQPIVRLDDDSVFAVEALVRWRRDGEIMLPGTFLDDVAKSGAMPLLTRNMMMTSLRELRSAGLPYPVAINVPPELVNPALIDEVLEALAATHSSPEQLLIEITEESIMRAPEAATPVLAELRSSGIRIELDDFGTGWSGLSSLRDLTVDGLKIDYTFVSRVLADPTALAIVRGVSMLAADLGIAVIYEGVEDEAVHEFLRTSFHGCGQGFAIARPMPIEDLVRWTALRDVSVDSLSSITSRSATAC